MSSDLFVFDNTFFSDPFAAFIDSTTIDDVLQEFQENSNDLIQENNKPLDQTSSFDQFTSANLEHLTISQLGNTEQSASVKTEHSHQFLDGFCGYNVNYNDKNTIWPRSYDGAHETAFKYMQRSLSSDSFENKPSNFAFQPQFSSVFESQDQQNQVFMSSSEAGQMRRVCSTGDLQKLKTSLQTRNNVFVNSPSSLSPLSTEKVARYSAEVRKERIDRYRAKRTQRNFNKTIKYACRKTLADSRPRIRGRFARNDEAVDIIPKASMFQRYEDDDDLCINGFNEEYEEGMAQRGTFFFDNYGSNSTHQYENFRY